MSKMPRPTAKALGDRHAQITVTPRLAFITKAMVRKSENRLISLYAGFGTESEAQNFAAYVARNWGKTSFDIAVRPSERTQSAWEVKVRRPSQEQLGAMVAKAQLHQLNQLQQPTKTAAQVMAELDAMPTCTDRKRATTYRGVSID